MNESACMPHPQWFAREKPQANVHYQHDANPAPHALATSEQTRFDMRQTKALMPNNVDFQCTYRAVFF